MRFFKWIVKPPNPLSPKQNSYLYASLFYFPSVTAVSVYDSRAKFSNIQIPVVIYKKNPADILQHMKNIVADKAQWHVVYFVNYFKVQQRTLNLYSDSLQTDQNTAFEHAMNEVPRLLSD